MEPYKRMSPTCCAAPGSKEHSSAAKVKEQSNWPMKCGRKPKNEPKSNSGHSECLCSQKVLQIGLECYLKIILKRYAALTGQLKLLFTGLLKKELM